jgi:hypothetical protein
MQYQVYRKVDEHYRSILKLASADTREASGKIKKNQWSADELSAIKQQIEERLPELHNLESGFAIEVKLNLSEDHERAGRYFNRLDEALSTFHDSFSLLLDIWQQLKTPGKIDYGSIESLQKLVTSIEIFIDILISYEPLKPAEFTDELSQKLIYLQFSGITDTIRNSLKEKLHKEHITNVRLAETLALITDDNQVEIEKLLPKLSQLAEGNSHPVFTADVIGKAIAYLEKDGFDASQLKAVGEKCI